MLVHGTDETAFDNELIDHVQGEAQTWLELSDRLHFVIVCLQVVSGFPFSVHSFPSLFI